MQQSSYIKRKFGYHFGSLYVGGVDVTILCEVVKSAEHTCSPLECPRTATYTCASLTSRRELPPLGIGDAKAELAPVEVWHEAALRQGDWRNSPFLEEAAI